jgi:hypothetical protein
MGSHLGRSVARIEVPVDRWSATSHITPFYVERATRHIASYQRSLHAQVPSAPSHATFFFGNVPGSIAWQVADGPYVRWTYRDPTLRSYYLNQLSPELVTRGPVFMFLADGDTLKNVSGDVSMLYGIALRAIGQENWAVASGATELLLRRLPHDQRLLYLRAWTAMAIGASAEASWYLTQWAVKPAREAPGHRRAPPLGTRLNEEEEIVQLEEAIRLDALNPELHRRLADLTLTRPSMRRHAIIEALAARVLAPDNPGVLYRWAMAQALLGQYGHALLTLRLAESAGLAPQIVAPLERDLKERAQRQLDQGQTEGQALIPAGL